MHDSQKRDPRISLRLQKLCEANQSLAHVESLEELVPRLLDLAKTVTDAEASSFMIYDAEKQVLRFSAVKDDCISETALADLRGSVELQVGQGIAGWVAREKKPLIVADVSKDDRFFSRVDASTGFVTRSILCVPVFHRNELLGVIEVLNARERACFDDDDRDLLVSFADLAAVAIIRARLLQERLNQQKIRIEMETAAKIQALFRPKAPELGHDSRIWAVSESARYVGGDLYDVIALQDGSWLIYVADVSDKGLPAALIMVALWYRIRSEANLYKDVAGLLDALNAALTDLLEAEGYFVTIIIGQYWPLEGRLEYACGGHLPALRISGRRSTYLEVEQGPSLGLFCCPRYAKAKIRLEAGESILFITDGVTEAFNSENELFGRRRVEGHIARSQGPPWGPGLLNEVKGWQKNTEPSDDLTLLEIWRDPIKR